MTDAAAPAEIPLADRQLDVLAELAEIGLKVARAVGRKAEAPDADPAVLSLAYARVSRAVRLTIQLQSQIAEGAVPAEPPQPVWTPHPERVRKDRVEAIVRRIAKAEHDDDDTVDELVEEAGERLDDDDLYGDLMDHPVSEIVARICKDLGLDPDWTTLAQELWAKREMQSGAAGGPLRALKAAHSLLLPQGESETIAEGDRSNGMRVRAGPVGEGNGGAVASGALPDADCAHPHPTLSP